MARKVFFSFHYERDAGRSSIVRNHSITKDGFGDAGYIDAVAWESLKRQGDDAIKRWINSQLKGTTVTVVLIGAETANRPWVQYEIRQSRANGNGLLGVRIHNLKDFRTGQIDFLGSDPFVTLGYTGVAVYDWQVDSGYDNFANWVETAAIQKWTS